MWKGLAPLRWPLKPFWRTFWFHPTSGKSGVAVQEEESEKDFWIWEKVTCEDLGLCSLEDWEGGREKSHVLPERR